MNEYVFVISFFGLIKLIVKYYKTIVDILWSDLLQ